jgi:hypothetical protein
MEEPERAVERDAPTCEGCRVDDLKLNYDLISYFHRQTARRARASSVRGFTVARGRRGFPLVVSWGDRAIKVEAIRDEGFVSRETICTS